MKRYQIRARRRTLGLSQTEVARQIGMSADAYGRVERGVGQLTAEQMTRLADLLGLDARHVQQALDMAPAELPRDVGERIRAARRARRWTQADLVNRLQEGGYPVSRQTIVRLEAGESQSLRLIGAVAAALEIPPAELGVPDARGMVVPASTIATVAWDLFYYGSARLWDLEPMLHVWLANQSGASVETARLWQLYGVMRRDANDADGAIQALTRGIEHASRIGAVDLHAAGLMRRARAWTDAAPRQTDAIAEALRDAEAAIGMRSAIDPRLVGALLTQWIKTMAHDPATTMADLERRADEAARLAALYAGRDPTGMHLDSSGVIHAAIDGAITVLTRASARPDDALILRTEAARMLLDPQQGRWNAALHLSMAELYWRTGASDAALETLARIIPHLTSARHRRRAHRLLHMVPVSAERRAVEELLYG